MSLNIENKEAKNIYAKDFKIFKNEIFESKVEGFFKTNYDVAHGGLHDRR